MGPNPLYAGIQLDLTGATHIRIEELNKAKVDSASHRGAQSPISSHRYNSLQLKISVCALQLCTLQRQGCGPVINSNGRRTRNLHRLIAQAQGRNIDVRLD